MIKIHNRIKFWYCHKYIVRALSHLLFLWLLWVLLWMKPYYDASYPIVSGWSGEGEECKHERGTKTVSMTTTGDSPPSFLESQSTSNVLSDNEQLPYSGKLSREKTFTNFSFVAIRKTFLCKIWGCGILWCEKSEQSLLKVSCYMVCHHSKSLVIAVITIPRPSLLVLWFAFSIIHKSGRAPKKKKKKKNGEGFEYLSS